MNMHAKPAIEFATVEGRHLHAALKPLLFVVERRVTYPILASVKLAMKGTVLTLTATDLDIDISTEIDVNDAGGEWIACVDARVLSGIARAAGNECLRIETSQRVETDAKGKPFTTAVANVAVGDGSTTYEIANVFTADNFPCLSGVRGPLIETFGNGLLPLSLRKVRKAICTEEVRYYLNGACWGADANGRWFAACDGHRLIKNVYSPEGDATASARRIIPTKTVDLILRHFGADDFSVYAVGDAKLEFATGRTVIRTKCIEGTYPDIDRVTPKREGVKHRFEIVRQDLIEAIGRVSAVATKSSYALRFAPERGHIGLGLRTADLGRAETQLSSAWPEGASEFGLNRHYLRDLVSECQGNITLHMTDAGAPFLVTDDDESVTRVLMPMRV